MILFNKIIKSTNVKIKLFAFLSLVLCFALFAYYRYRQPAYVEHDTKVIDEINQTLKLLEDGQTCAQHLKIISRAFKSWPISIISANRTFRLESGAKIGPYLVEKSSLEVMVHTPELIYADLVLEFSHREYKLRKQVPLILKNFQGTTICQSYMRPIK